MSPTQNPTAVALVVTDADMLATDPAGHEVDAEQLDGSLAVAATRGSRSRRLAERGMVTAEYAVGILSAIAFALVLLKVFHDNSVFTAMLHYVTSLIGQLSSQIK